MADEPNLAKEMQEAADAAGTAARTRKPEDIVKAKDEAMDVVRIGIAQKWDWPKWLSAFVMLSVLALAAYYVAVKPTPSSVQVVAEPDPKKSEPLKKVGDEADVVKVVTDGLTKLDKSLTALDKSLIAGIKSIEKKLDEKPAPLPVDPDKPKPKPEPAKKLTLPERVEVAVGSVVKVKATGSANVQWTWRDSPGLDVDKHGSTLYVSAERDGVYWVFAYTSADGKINDIAVCMIVAGKGPQPPPGPTPEPKPPVPTDWPTTAPGLRVLIVFEEMERHKLAPTQRAIIDGAPIRDWLDSKCVQDGQVKAWRIFDQNQGVQGAEKHWQEMMGRKRSSVPWVVICNYPKAWYEGVLPNNVDELKAAIQKVE